MGTAGVVQGLPRPLHSVSRRWRPGQDRSAPHTWHMVEALQCETTDDTYTWLNTALAVWGGEFDMTTSRHRYHAYTSSDTLRVIT